MPDRVAAHKRAVRSVCVGLHARATHIASFILMHSVGSKPGSLEVDVPLNYADCCFLEALLRYRDLQGGS